MGCSPEMSFGTTRATTRIRVQQAKSFAACRLDPIEPPCVTGQRKENVLAANFTIVARAGNRARSRDIFGKAKSTWLQLGSEPKLAGATCGSGITSWNGPSPLVSDSVSRSVGGEAWSVRQSTSYYSPPRKTSTLWFETGG